jgi:hypothetical protein
MPRDVTTQPIIPRVPLPGIVSHRIQLWWSPTDISPFSRTTGGPLNHTARTVTPTNSHKAPPKQYHPRWSNTRLHRTNWLHTIANAQARARGLELSQQGGGRLNPINPPVLDNAPKLASSIPHTITSLEDWAHLLRTYTHEQFPSLLTRHDDKSCIPCTDASSVALLRRSQIERYVYGAWQDTREVHNCMEGKFKIL